MTQTDAALLDGGPDGYVAALRAEQLDGQVVLIEEERIGGVPPNVTGIRTKAPLPSAEVYRVFHVLCNRCQSPRSEKAVDALDL